MRLRRYSDNNWWPWRRFKTDNRERILRYLDKVYESRDCRKLSPVQRKVYMKVWKRAQKVCSRFGINLPRVTVRECQDVYVGNENIVALHHQIKNHIMIDSGWAGQEIRDVFAHELAHVIVTRLKESAFGDAAMWKERSHGETWQYIMKLLGEPVPKRYLDDSEDRKLAQAGRNHRSRR